MREKERERERELRCMNERKFGGGGIKVKAREENREVEAMTMEGDRLRETGSRRRWREGRDGAKQRERREGRGVGWITERKLCTQASDFYSPKKHLWDLPVCVCLNAWTVGWLRVKEAIMCVSPPLASSSLSLAGTAEPLCWERHDAHCHPVLLHHSCIPSCSLPI